MEGKGAVAAAISAVLDDDDLLGEILLRLAFPTSLVRAVLVCKRWLSIASARPFLRRFCDLHPAGLLGFYVDTMVDNFPRFVPMPQPPELAAVLRRASFDLHTLGFDILDVRCCRCDGLLLLTSHPEPGSPEQPERMVRSPLDPARDMAVLPRVPDTCIHDGFTYYDIDEIIPSGGGDGLSFFHLALGSNGQQTSVDVFVLQDDIWAIYSSVVTEIPNIELMFYSLIGDSKIYNVVADRENMVDKLFVLDLGSSSLSLVDLPEEDMDNYGSTQLSLTDDSHLHLTHVKGSKLRIWLHKMDNNAVSSWFLEGTLCLREICANYMIPTCKFKDVNASVFKVHEVDVGREFVFLEMDNVLYLFDIKNKAAKKVYEVTPEDEGLANVTPFMMVWPPKFPVMKERCDPKE